MKPNPVILVHGIFDTAKIFRRMQAHLRRLGRTAHAIDLMPNNGKISHLQMARQLANFIDTGFSGTPVDLVGFSMGGIVARAYVQMLGGHEKVHKLVTISAPHHGTALARLLKRPVAMEMRPGSGFLETLNSGTQILEKMDFTSLWTPYDLVILPASSSVMDCAKNIQVAVPWHDWMVRLPNALKALSQALC